MKLEELKKEIIDWQNFYKNVFQMDVDFSKIHIPKKQPGFDRLIIVAKGMASQRVYNSCQGLFLCKKEMNKSLKKEIKSEDRTAVRAYAIWIRDRVEADKELKNLSANDLTERKVQGITLTERLILEVKYFKETGEHLDLDNYTLCSGSRLRNKIFDVPNVSYYSGMSHYSKLHIQECCSAVGKAPNIRTREVIC